MFMRKGLESLYLVSRPSPAVSTVYRVLAVNLRLCLSLFTREITTQAVLLWNLWMYNVNLEGQNRQKYTKLSFED